MLRAHKKINALRADKYASWKELSRWEAKFRTISSRFFFFLKTPSGSQSILLNFHALRAASSNALVEYICIYKKC